MQSQYVARISHRVSAEQRLCRNGHKGGVLWFTGLSGSGKSTLAFAVEEKLFHNGVQVYVLDGDNIRCGLNSDLDFSPVDRGENIRRVGEVAALFADAGMIVVSALISPYAEDRVKARKVTPDFHEIFIQADLATCEARDPKGLYKKARRGEIVEFTGISAPYEQPAAPELTVNTQALSERECLDLLLDYIHRSFMLPVA